MLTFFSFFCCKWRSLKQRNSKPVVSNPITDSSGSGSLSCKDKSRVLVCGVWERGVVSRLFPHLRLLSHWKSLGLVACFGIKSPAFPTAPATGHEGCNSMVIGCIRVLSQWLQCNLSYDVYKEKKTPLELFRAPTWTERRKQNWLSCILDDG